MSVDRFLIPVPPEGLQPAIASLVQQLSDPASGVVELVAVVPLHERINPHTTLRDTTITPEVRAQAEALLQSVAQQLDHPRIEQHVLGGEPASVILQRARGGGASMIAMETRGRRGLSKLLLGSVTEAVLRGAPCPVVVVPPSAAEDPP